MFNTFRNIALAVIMMLGLVAPLTLPALPVAAVTSKQAACQGIGLTGEACNNGNNGAQTRVGNAVQTIVNILTVAVGIAAVIMIIVGGFKYVVSGGDSNKVSSAKNTLLYAIIGLIVVSLAQFIIRFVFQRF